MISYQWDVQKSMIQLKTQLQAQGYKVWMDIDEMGGSTLESMAKAVENASVVLVCVSQKYKESPNCRSGNNLQCVQSLTLTHVLLSHRWRRFCFLSRACDAGYSCLSRSLFQAFGCGVRREESEKKNKDPTPSFFFCLQLFALSPRSERLPTFDVVFDDFFWPVTCSIWYSFGVELEMVSQQSSLFLRITKPCVQHFTPSISPNNVFLSFIVFRIYLFFGVSNVMFAIVCLKSLPSKSNWDYF